MILSGGMKLIRDSLLKINEDDGCQYLIHALFIRDIMVNLTPHE